MSIEVRQMIVKTSVVHRIEDDPLRPGAAPDKAATPDMRRLLEQCRRMIAEMLGERRER